MTTIRPFYKYYTANTALKNVLNEGTIKWSASFEFNDPFDNQFSLNLEKENNHTTHYILEKFLTYPDWSYFNIVSKSDGKVLFTGPQLKSLWDQIPIGPLEKEDLKVGVDEGIDIVKKHFPMFQEKLNLIMRDTSIFCVTESPDNILMWSHYANSHSGIVIEFTPSVKADSPLLLAKPVQYTKELPQINFIDFFSFTEEEGIAHIHKIVNLFTLSKSIDWQYEREWRVISKLRNKNKTYELCGFAPEEITALYLGCTIKKEDKEEALTLINAKYPTAKVFQAKKSPTQYALEFEEVPKQIQISLQTA